LIITGETVQIVLIVPLVRRQYSVTLDFHLSLIHLLGGAAKNGKIRGYELKVPSAREVLHHTARRVTAKDQSQGAVTPLSPQAPIHQNQHLVHLLFPRIQSLHNLLIHQGINKQL